MPNLPIVLASQDLLNYLKFHWNLIGRENTKIILTEKIQRCFEKDPKELQEFIDLWSGIWMKKWNERVKVLITNEDHVQWKKRNHHHLKIEPIWRKLNYRDEMKDVIVSKLIKNGEICGTSILAENLLKSELTKNSVDDIYSNQKLLNVIINTMKKAKDLSQSKGPLIFVRIDKKFFINYLSK